MHIGRGAAHKTLYINNNGPDCLLGEGRRGDVIRRLLSAIPVLPLDREAAGCAAEVRQKLDRTGQAIGMGDSLIAGIALTHGLPLFTRNQRHFERVAGLKLVAAAP